MFSKCSANIAILSILTGKKTIKPTYHILTKYTDLLCSNEWATVLCLSDSFMTNVSFPCRHSCDHFITKGHGMKKTFVCADIAERIPAGRRSVPLGINLTHFVLTKLYRLFHNYCISCKKVLFKILYNKSISFSPS